jgi:hypothetical protein
MPLVHPTPQEPFGVQSANEASGPRLNAGRGGILSDPTRGGDADAIVVS